MLLIMLAYINIMGFLIKQLMELLIDEPFNQNNRI